MDNPEDYRSKSLKKLSIKQILLQQIQILMNLQTVEFMGGYNKKSIEVINGEPQLLEEYIPDNRETLINGIYALDRIVSSFIVADMEKADKVLQKTKDVKGKIKERYNKYIKDLKDEKQDDEELRYKYLSDKRMLTEDLFCELLFILKHSELFDEEEDQI